MTDAALPSWNDGPARQAIVDFVTATTTPGSDFVAAADRIATFDNDGTLWVEQPLPPTRRPERSMKNSTWIWWRATVSITKLSPAMIPWA
jgi:hypothetical protein